MLELLDTTLFATVRSGTPLLLIALGVLVSERAGVLNLGQEGMVLVGAAAAFVTADAGAGHGLACLAGVAAGAVCAAGFALLVIGLRANQVAAGLALTIFGTGLASLIAADAVGRSISGMQPLAVPGLSALPLLGRTLFAQDALVYVSLGLTLAVAYLFQGTRLGLALVAAGHDPRAAYALGLPVIRLRVLATLAGGAFAGLAGAYLALVYTPLWSESISAGRGWIALALVVFAGWRVARLPFAAYLFGLAGILHLVLQGRGIEVSPNLLALTPYVVTIAALVLLGSRYGARNAPRALGRAYRSGD